MTYDTNNVFAKILKGNIPCNKIYENEYALAFHDISPKAPTHVLVIPKGPYLTQDDFAGKASDQEISGFERAIAHVVHLVGADKTGYRLIANSGSHGHQEVPHYHVHILAGRLLGPMLVEKI